MHYFDPHFPYNPPPAFTNRFQTDDDLKGFLAAKQFVDPGEPSVLQWNNSYDGEISFVDSQVERLLAKLRTTGFYDESAVVFFSDHGEGLGQHQWVGHGHIHNEQLFVPLIMKLPAAIGRAGERCRGIVSLVDILPTLAAALDLPLAPDKRENIRYERDHILTQNDVEAEGRFDDIVA